MFCFLAGGKSWMNKKRVKAKTTYTGRLMLYNLGNNSAKKGYRSCFLIKWIKFTVRGGILLDDSINVT